MNTYMDIAHLAMTQRLDSRRLESELPSGEASQSENGLTQKQFEAEIELAWCDLVH